MLIGLLQCYDLPTSLSERHGTVPDLYRRMLDGHGFAWRVWRVHDGELPDSPGACEGWLISGSTAGAYDPLPWIAPLEGFIRAIHAAGVPMVGICFGHQIMAQALGGRVEKFAGGWGAGRMDYAGPDGAAVRLHAMHQDQVVEAPPGAERTLASPFCANAGFDYGGRALSFQPHPEFGEAFTRDLIALRGGVTMPEARAAEALASLEREGDHSGAIARRIAEFLLGTRARQAA